jgi:hypothetical protein
LLSKEGCRTFSAPPFYYDQSPGFLAPLALYLEIIFGKGYKIILIPIICLLSNDRLYYLLLFVMLFWFCSAMFSLYLAFRLVRLEEVQANADESEDEY